MLDECTNYFKTLPRGEQDQGMGAFFFYQDGKGGHAIEFLTSRGWRNYHNFLIFNKDGKRTRVLRYRAQADLM